jgi:hypothetical protein
LGERLLCKQEVVGSIPSGSTNTRAHLLKFARIFRCGTAPGASMRRRASSALFESAIASLLERVLPKEPSFARARFEPLHLLHREEGIDLRLSLAAMPRKRRCRGMPPTPVSSV